MKIELAQIVTLIAHGNKFLFSGEKSVNELYPFYSPFRNVSDLTFLKCETSADLSGKPQIVARDVLAWFSFLREEGVKYLRLDLLNLQTLPMPYATSVMTAGNAWVIQTDRRTCWQSNWSLKKQIYPGCRIWNVGYWESDNVPVLMDFPDLEIAYRDLEESLLEAQNFSKRYGFDWEKWFAEALELLRSPFAVLPYYSDLLPDSYENLKGRQLLAGALKGWVFGELGSWNDMYFRESSQEREYQQVSKNLYQAVIQSVGAVANSTSIHQFAERTSSS